MEGTAADEQADASSSGAASAGASPAWASPEAAGSAGVVSADAAFEAVVAAVAVLAELRRGEREDPDGTDPLRRGVDGSLDRLAAISRLEGACQVICVSEVESHRFR